MFGFFEGLPEGERAYRLKADWLSAKLEFKKKHIGRIAEVDGEFREKLISNPEAALLYAGVDTKGIKVQVRFKRGGGTFLELRFQRRVHRSQKERAKEPLAFGIIPAVIIEIPLSQAEEFIPFPKFTSSREYAQDRKRRESKEAES
jgi:hypothetical protein